MTTPPSSNRTCGFPASGLPDGFTISDVAYATRRAAGCPADRGSAGASFARRVNGTSADCGVGGDSASDPARTHRPLRRPCRGGTGRSTPSSHTGPRSAPSPVGAAESRRSVEKSVPAPDCGIASTPSWTVAPHRSCASGPYGSAATGACTREPRERRGRARSNRTGVGVRCLGRGGDRDRTDAPD